MTTTRRPKPSEQTRELEAFLLTLAATPSTAPTACEGWTAHELLAHLAGGAEDIALAVEAALHGDPIPTTRSFDDREARYRALPDETLRNELTTLGLRVMVALDALDEIDPKRTVAFTGWQMTATALAHHIRSELALHRWDIAGDDETSGELLAQPELLNHAVLALSSFDGLSESANLARDDDTVAPADRVLRLWGRR